jgi:hypothetical protein
MTVCGCSILMYSEPLVTNSDAERAIEGIISVPLERAQKKYNRLVRKLDSLPDAWRPRKEGAPVLRDEGVMYAATLTRFLPSGIRKAHLTINKAIVDPCRVSDTLNIDFSCSTLPFGHVAECVLPVLISAFDPCEAELLATSVIAGIRVGERASIRTFCGVQYFADRLLARTLGIQRQSVIRCLSSLAEDVIESNNGVLFVFSKKPLSLSATKSLTKSALAALSVQVHRL